MIVTVNGDPLSIGDGATVASLLDRLGIPAAGKGVAVALGGAVVPRREWHQTGLHEGARIEVLTAIQGG